MGKRDRIKRSPRRIKLTLSEIKEVVSATSSAIKSEGSTDEDQNMQSLFGSLQDSCELAKGRIAGEEANKLGLLQSSYEAAKGREHQEENTAILVDTPQSNEVDCLLPSATPHDQQGVQNPWSMLQEKWDVKRQKEELQR